MVCCFCFILVYVIRIGCVSGFGLRLRCCWCCVRLWLRCWWCGWLGCYGVCCFDFVVVYL